jgi:hypothetical protein
MRFVSLTILNDFIQVLNIKRKHYTKDDDFSYSWSIYYNLVTAKTEIRS